MKYKKGMVLFSVHHYGEEDRQDMIKEAKNYIKTHSYTQDDVRIAQRGSSIVVVAK